MDEAFECILVDKWIYIGVLSLFCIICVQVYEFIAGGKARR